MPAQHFQPRIEGGRKLRPLLFELDANCVQFYEDTAICGILFKFENTFFSQVRVSMSQDPVVLWELKQGSPEWFAVRSCYLTASDFSTVLGFNPYKSLTDFVNALTSSEPETCMDPSLTAKPVSKRSELAMQWGKDHEEDGVFEYFLDRFGFDENTWPISAPGLVVDYNRKLAVSPDRFVGDDGILGDEVPFTKAFYKDGMPLAHKAQIYGLLGVSNRAYIDYVQYIPYGGILVERLDRTPEFEADWIIMKQILETFVDTYKDVYARRKKYVFSSALCL